MATKKTGVPKDEKVKWDDADYPNRLRIVLKNKAPETLHFRGNASLLERDAIGFCGSRKSSQKGIETIQDCVKQASSEGVTIVSGNAAGIDFEAHYHALSAGGSTILVLPEGISHFRIRRALAPVWDWERALVVSQFNPDDAWKNYRAMARNQVIIGLSKAIIAVEAGEKGGTMNAGIEALKHGIPLYVVEYEDMTVDVQGNKKTT